MKVRGDKLRAAVGIWAIILVVWFALCAVGQAIAASNRGTGTVTKVDGQVVLDTLDHSFYWSNVLVVWSVGAGAITVIVIALGLISSGFRDW